MKTVSLKDFTPEGVTRQDNIFSFPPEGGRLSAQFAPGTLFGETVSPQSYLVMDVTNLSPYSCSVSWQLYSESGAHEIIKMGVLPHVKTRLALPLSAFEGGTLFLRRTPGKLKTVVLGAPVKLAELCKFSISLPKNVCRVPLEIHSFFISETEPEYETPDVVLVDELGQRKKGDWKGKTPSRMQMHIDLRNELSRPVVAFSERDLYGGWKKKRFDASGFFRLVRDENRFWLADPDGYAFFSTGLDCVGIDGDANLDGIEQFCEKLPPHGAVGWAPPRNGNAPPPFFSHAKANLASTFGEQYYEKWTELTRKRMLSWGFNTIACWSDERFITKSQLPYVHILNGFPSTETRIFRDFPDVFSDEYRENSRKWAKQLVARANDKLMIGYFMSNEPNWAFVDNLPVAKMTLEKGGALASRAALIETLRGKYGSIAALNDAWDSDFVSFDEIRPPFSQKADEDLDILSKMLVKEFVKVPALALREIDKHHLNLGMRYAWISGDMVSAGCEYFDVFSINCYKYDPYETIEQSAKLSSKPVMIGEFHFGALDRGLDATGIQGVATQDDRAKAFKYYMQRAASHPYCLGAHYFTLNDQSYLGRFDGENYQIGFVDVCNKPYEELVSAAKDTNRIIYRTAAGELPVTNVRAEEIPAICY
ncbi:MAG: beta-galactosidase [Clostridia bacterium]|nr:beta-galactosidase [Clostridia bacterium]